MGVKTCGSINNFWIFVLWLQCINIAKCAFPSENINQNLSRFQRQTRCGINEFQCRDRSCILEELLCDGIVDCLDGTDETTDCKLLPCNSFYGYKCDYGACAKKEARCNGVIECKDSSDERGCTKVNPTYDSQRSCSVTEFTCKSGDCIHNDKLCDGIADCRDNSDETQECEIFSCKNAFRCRYGACAVKDAHCNGVEECFDGSDEEGCTSPINLTSKPLLAESTSCLVPKPPSNGRFINSNNPQGSFAEGDYVPNFNELKTHCDAKFETTPPNKSFPICFNGNWTLPPLQCARVCASLVSTETKSVTCTFNGVLLDSCTDPVEGTVASFECRNLYESESKNLAQICINGKWDRPIPECRPVCGKKPATTIQNTIGKRIAKKGDYPWHVGIYSNEKNITTHICGGSLIDRNIIVTGAHCLTDSNGEIYPKKNYLVAAGKHYRSYYDNNDPKSQYASIKNIYVPNRFKGPIRFYESDIAVVVLNHSFTLTAAVQPVCVDWNNDFEYEQLTINSSGVIVGWSYNANRTSILELLQELSVPYVPENQCFEHVPKDFRKFITYDKMCAGFLSIGVGVCSGDGGGGLTFKNEKNDRYYIRGILSTSPVNKDFECDVDQYAMYTLISKHLDFIKSIKIANTV